MEVTKNTFVNMWAEIFTFFNIKNRINNIFHLSEFVIS